MKAALALLAIAAPAYASTVRPLTPAQLAAGADRVVEGTIVARAVRWNGAHTGLETHAIVAVARTLAGPVTPTVEIVEPGGELDGGVEIVVGKPSLELGESARWFLAARGTGAYRVYGWAQGKWPARGDAFAFDPIAAEHAARTPYFTTNGMVWPADKIPVPYYINMTGSDDLSLADVTTAVDAAFATWQAVPCSTLSFADLGTTDLGAAIDTTNVILFVESGWTEGDEAAAATSLWIIAGMQTADISVNGQDWTWAIGPPSNAIDNNTLDLQAVLTHETGHFSGLNHSMRAFDTMYYSWKPWQDQRLPSYDDKQGLCSIYPQMVDECPPVSCPADQTCASYPLGTMCTGTPDPVGAACNYDHTACDSFCLYTAANLSTGYCSQFCTQNTDCPLAYHCGAATSGTANMVCLVGAQPIQDPCTTDTDCVAGTYCNGTSCTFDCRSGSDCVEGDTCDDTGRCAKAKAGGGGCQSLPGAAWLVALWICGFILRRTR